MNEIVRYDLELSGCTPEPLMAYLKALGILRLVSEQKDPNARGWWMNDIFHLRSSLDKNALVTFFHIEYRPTPIVAPWAGGSGFFGGDNKQAVEALCTSRSTRCESYANVIRHVREIIADEDIRGKPGKEEKSRLIRRYRRELPDEVVAWMDAAMVIQKNGQEFARVLGTGGNDGRLNFTQNFMQRIVSLRLHGNEQPSNESPISLVGAALFGTRAKLGAASVGQFAPGRAGGPNATQGMEGDSTDNAWDFLLMLEGAIMLAGAAVRRYGLDTDSWAAFPFTVRAVAAGFDSPASKDEIDSRGELWLPLWSRPASVSELRQLFGEGRAEVSGRHVRNGTDFARAMASLGVDRGIAEFSRIGFLKRSGKAFLALPLGRFAVTERFDIDLLREADSWLERFRSATVAKDAPPRFAAALRRIDSAIIEFCKYGGKPLFQNILVALGAAERELPSAEQFRKRSKLSPTSATSWPRAMAHAEQFRKRSKLSPLAKLSGEWVKAANDNSHEFIIARSLAFIRDSEGKVGPLRANLEPVDWQQCCSAWAEKGRSVVWNAADLSTNLANVLQRRMMDAERAGCESLPLASRFYVTLKNVASYIAGELDDERIEQLIWGLMLIDTTSKEAQKTRARQETVRPNPETRGPSAVLPREYALLKLLFLPRPLVPERSGEKVCWRLARRLSNGNMETGLVVRPEPRILPLLRAGRVGEACNIAAQRLRVSGLPPMPGPLPTGKTRDHYWAERATNQRAAQRLAAALLIPISVIR